jgi:ABC-type lipoprotein release transport system permease subunit
MGALRLLFRAEFRRRWRSWLALATLIAVVGGVVLAAAAAGRRTESAFPRFAAAYGFDVGVYAMRPVPKLAKLPGVSSATDVVGPFSGQPTCDCTNPINPTDFEVLVVPPGGRPIYKLISGHLPDPSAPDQVLASFTLQQNDGVHLGTVIHVPFYSAAQAPAYDNAIGAPPRPDGPIVAFHVVGFEAAESEFPSGSSPSYDLYTTPAFASTVLPRTATGDLYIVRLRNGAAGVPQFSQQVSSLGAEAYSPNEVAASVQASIHPQAVGWWILALLAALVALAVVGQALVRQSIVESEDYPTMAAIGADRRQLLALGLARNVAVGLAGAAGAVVVATALSPLAPLGEARIAETSTGVTFDPPVLALGAFGTVLVVFGLGIWPALRATRPLRAGKRTGEPRPSAVVAVLAGLGAPPSAMIGVRNALERRSGGATVPVGAALIGTALAVAALCATGVFGASLSNLTATPRLYGAPFQLNISNPSGGPPPPALLASLEHNKAVSGIMKGFAAQVFVNKITVGAAVVTPIKGQVLLSTVSGHVPDGDGQIGLGATTMRQAGAHLGSVVRVTVSSPSGGRRTAPFRVVSQISFPVLSGLSLGTGSAFTTSGYENAACPPGPRRSACLRALSSEPAPGGFLVSFVPGPRGQAAISHYLDTYQSIAALVIAPTALVNFGEAVNFPLIFGAMLAVFGAATLVHLLVVSVSRRRREIGLLKALGFVNGQVAATVAWQATTVAVVGIVIGAPLGILIGRTMWSAFASNLGFVPVAIVQVWLLAALIAGVLVAANLLAALPALAARRYQAGQLLRTQ